MTDLEQAFTAISAESLDAVKEHPKLWQQLLQQQSALFDKVKQNKPNSADESHLLGIMTKAHIECLSRVETNREAVQAMWKALTFHILMQSENWFISQITELNFVTVFPS